MYSLLRVKFALTPQNDFFHRTWLSYAATALEIDAPKTINISAVVVTEVPTDVSERYDQVKSLATY